MLDQNTIQYLIDTVCAYMEQQQPFTSLDIANQAKSKGFWARNHEVAEWLRSNVISLSFKGNYLYNQTLISVDSKQVGMTLAYLYHHHQDAPDNYLDRDQNPQSMRRSSTFGGGVVTPIQTPSLSAQVADITKKAIDAVNDQTVRYGLTRGKDPVVDYALPTTQKQADNHQKQRAGHDGWKHQKRDSMGRFK